MEFSYFFFLDGHYSIFFWLGLFFRDDLHEESGLTWYLLLVVPQGQQGTHFSHCGGTGMCNWGRRRLLLSATVKDSPRVIWLEENILHSVVLGALCDFLFRILSLLRLQPQHLEG
jgi:hypothetical protein